MNTENTAEAVRGFKKHGILGIAQGNGQQHTLLPQYFWAAVAEAEDSLQHRGVLPIKGKVLCKIVSQCHSKSRICSCAQRACPSTYIFFSFWVGHGAIQSTEFEVSQVTVIHQNVKHHSHLWEQQDLQNQKDSLIACLVHREMTVSHPSNNLQLYLMSSLFKFWKHSVQEEKLAWILH